MTGSLPNGNILAPLTALGMTVEGRRVLIRSLRVDSIDFPAAEMSAPESGRALVLQEPFAEMTSRLTNGAGLHVECCLV